MSSLAAAMRRHPVIAFFLLAYGIGWSPWPLYAAGVLPDTNFLPLAPLAAALIVAAVTQGWAGLRDLGARMIRWRVPWYCYLAAVGLPLLVIFGTAGVNVGLGGSSWSLSAIAWADVAIMFAIRWVNPLDGPLGEEPGWRGFALPRMQATWSPLVSAAVLGVLAAVWHTPLIVSGEGNAVGWVGLATTVSITFVYVWLFNRSHGSVLLVMLFHIMQGTITSETLGYTGADIDRMLWLGFAAWTVVALAVVVLDRGAWRVPPRDAVAPPPTGRPAGPVLTTSVVRS